MDYTAKLARFNEAILAYEDALADYRRAKKAAGDGEVSLAVVEEAREEVLAAHARFGEADRALNA
jgi:hypothetical protein